MMQIALSVAVTLVSVVVTCANEENHNFVISYLRKYGYLQDEQTDQQVIYNETLLSHAIQLFQEFYDLPVKNGKLDAELIRIMSKSRCGVKDINNGEFSQNYLRWPRTNLTWNFKLASEDTLRMTAYAFQYWADVSALTFERDVHNPDILISMQSGIHPFADKRVNQQCNYSFDGPGNILGHAYSPTGHWNHVSEVHIDGAESWYILLQENPPDTFHMLQTMIHEIGHALGLSHSTRNDSVMFPMAPTKQFPVRLSLEDRINIQNLYGTKPEVSSTSTPKSYPITTDISTTDISTTDISIPLPLDLYKLKRIDTILVMKQRIFISHGLHLWSINLDGKSKDKPLLLTDYMRFLPKNFTRISAAYQRPSGEIVLFVNKKIYVVKYPSLTLKFTLTLSDIGLPNSSKINAAFNTHSGRTFVLYDNDRVAEINECSMKVANHYPQKTIFPSVPTEITLAFRFLDGHLYFVGKRRDYFQFSEFEDTVTSSGKFNLSLLGITCPRDGILQQLRNLLDRLTRISETESSVDEDDDNFE